VGFEGSVQRHSQWRDRAGISPASLLRPCGHPRQLFDFQRRRLRRRAAPGPQPLGVPMAAAPPVSSVPSRRVA